MEATTRQTPLRTPSGAQINTVNEIRARGDDLMDLLNMIGDSPELTQSKLRLEEALMWAVKHATRY